MATRLQLWKFFFMSRRAITGSSFCISTSPSPLSFGQFLLHQPQEYAMGLALSRTDDNNMSTLHHIYAKDKSFIRQHNARKVARRLSKSMIGKPSNFKVCCFVLWLGPRPAKVSRQTNSGNCSTHIILVLVTIRKT